MATPQQIAITQLYTALFNRAPDAAGLAFWDQAMSNGASIDTIAQSFLTAPEALAIYPSTAPTTLFVARFYTTVFGREPDPEGLAFWSAALDAQGGAGNAAARAALVTQLVDIVSTPLETKPAGISDDAYAQTVADRGRFINKTDVGVYFATELKSNDQALAAKVLAGVTHELASVTGARDIANGTPVGVPGSGGGNTGGGGNGGGGVTPPAGPPAISNADTIENIGARLSSYKGSEATVDAAGMGDAKLAAVLVYRSKVAADGIKNLSLKLEGTSLWTGDVADLLKKTNAATVDVTGGTSFLQTIADQVSHIADGGITGTMQLSSAVGLAFLAPLLGVKLANSAVVDVDAAYMGKDHFTLLAENIEKIDNIDNLTIYLGSLSGMPGDETITALLTKASNPTFDLLSASDAQLHMLAARIIAAEPTTVTGWADLSKGGFDLAEIKALLSKLPGATRVSGENLSTAELVGLSDYLGKIYDIVDAHIVLSDSAMTDDATAALLSKVGSAEVDMTDARPAQFDAIRKVFKTAALKLSGELALTSATIPDDMTEALWIYGGNTATVDVTDMTDAQWSVVVRELRKIGKDGITGDLVLESTDGTYTLSGVLEKTSADAKVTVNATDMYFGQFEVIAQYMDKIDSVINLSITNLASAALPEEAFAKLLPKAIDARLVVTDASTGKVAALLSNLPSIADAGMSGTISLDTTQFAGAKTALDVKLDANAKAVITGTADGDTVDLRTWSHDTKLIAGGGADLVHAGTGIDTIRIESVAHSRGASFDTADTHTDNIDQVLGFAEGDLLSFSAAVHAYGPTLTFLPSVTKSSLSASTYVAADDENVSIQTLLDFVNGQTEGPLASHTVSAQLYAVTVEGGSGLSGTLLVLNDAMDELNEDDLIISVSGAITKDSFIFAYA